MKLTPTDKRNTPKRRKSVRELRDTFEMMGDTNPKYAGNDLSLDFNKSDKPRRNLIQGCIDKFIRKK